MAPLKENSKLSVTDPKEMEIQKMLKKEFKIIVSSMKQQNTEKKINEIRKNMQEQNEKLTRDRKR